MLPQKEVSGLEFVCLEKWNRQLVKMVTGKALDLRPGKASESGSLKAKVWDEIVEERQKVANQKLQEALEVDNGQAQDAQAARGAKKNKVVRAGSKHMLMLPEVIDIECRQHGLKVLLEGINTQVIWMHFTEDNINWLKNEVGAEGSEASGETAIGQEANTRRQQRGSRRRAAPGGATERRPVIGSIFSISINGLREQLAFLRRKQASCTYFALLSWKAKACMCTDTNTEIHTHTYTCIHVSLHIYIPCLKIKQQE